MYSDCKKSVAVLARRVLHNSDMMSTRICMYVCVIVVSLHCKNEISVLYNRSGCAVEYCLIEKGIHIFLKNYIGLSKILIYIVANNRIFYIVF